MNHMTFFAAKHFPRRSKRKVTSEFRNRVGMIAENHFRYPECVVSQGAEKERRFAFGHAHEEPMI